MKLLIQNKIEPVDIREIDEDSMMWTINDSNDNNANDTVGSIDIETKDKNKKVQIFSRSKDEKKEYLHKMYLETDEKNEKSPDKKSKSNEKNELDAI